MSAELLFVASSLACWLGLGCVLVGLWRATAWLARGPWPVGPRGLAVPFVSGGVLLLLSAGVPHDLGRAAAPLAWLPLFWPVMPFPGWFLVIALVMVGLRAVEALTALNSEQSKSRWTAAGAWAVFGLANLAWLGAMADKPTLLRGALPVEPTALAGVGALLVGAMAVVRLLSRALHDKGLGKKVAVYVGLVVGSAVFCLPLLWLLLTSFKEKQDNAGTGLVWVPMVTRQHAFTDGDPPLVAAQWEGRRIVGTVQGEKPGGKVEVDVERPFPFRGWRVEVEKSGLTTQPRQGIVVTATYEGQTVGGFVRKELVGGERQVEVLSPASLKGRVFLTSDSQPVRQVGVRWENYTEALEWLPPDTQNGLVYLKNSVWLVLTSVVGTVLSCSLVAYGFARVRFPGRSALFWVMLSTMMLPGAVTMLPRFLVWKGLGAVDTLVPIWLPAFTASAFNVFLLHEFFKTVPKELEDAAKIDGCSPLRTWWQVMTPQIKPALTVIGIWTFIGAWNDFMGPLVYVSSSEKMPVSYAIQMFATDKGGEFGMMMAFATMATLPVLVVFLLGQRYFVDGVKLSGLGGR